MKEEEKIIINNTGFIEDKLSPGIKEFISFLQDQKILDKYLINSLNEMDLITKDVISWNLGTAFTWSESPEGCRFWTDIYEKWLERKEEKKSWINKH